MHTAKPAVKKTILGIELWSNVVEYDDIPDYIVDADYVLLLSILRVADNSGTCLHPRISAILIHHSVILRHHLTLVDHCKGRLMIDSTENHLAEWIRESTDVKTPKLSLLTMCSRTPWSPVQGYLGARNRFKITITSF
jgi:hypothetical protein